MLCCVLFLRWEKQVSVCLWADRKDPVRMETLRVQKRTAEVVLQSRKEGMDLASAGNIDS